ncbi:spermidine synthase [Leptospira yasudae]|uniref:Polyamine aminopropyltransferase n=1 Tax=Leptospira yasudae TaxID=2202201 RepID=A0A6N4QSL1_9LEPT|nr:spermidine synthase [Leptospira yasudae]TGL73916.1 spermidine synthase [Leptospira yasudae]TGL79497.1 spermidine synthase [Leptospira yasudae]TGL90029.1 spermidine synthase [Leptospira yasudae]
MDPITHSWFTEQVDFREMHQFLKEKKSTSFRTKFQQVEFHLLNAFGRTVVLDGAVQSSEADEHIFHECLVHPALLTHPNPKKVLILGGGEGATLREVLKHPSIELAVMVDIDEEFVEFCKVALPDWNKEAFEDPRTELIHMDGRKYLEDTSLTFDIIITDITDILLDGPATRLYTKEFYELCSWRLGIGGILALQALELSPGVWEQHATLRRTIRKSFANVESYNIYIPSFTSSWGFIIASNSEDSFPSGDLIQERLMERELNGKLFAYDAMTHSGLFSLPKDLRKYLDLNGSIIEDGKPLTFFPKDRNYRKGTAK